MTVRHLIETIRDNIIGDDQTVESPFGRRRVTYADYTASGRALTFIESYIRRVVLPFYANTHSELAATGRQTTQFREEARRIIHDAVGAGDKDVVLFCGSGATGAIHHLVEVLNLRLPADLDRQYELGTQIPAAERPVVFVGPYEHHSNELPWRESIADVVVIDEDADGLIDLLLLESALEEHSSRRLKIGSFSAASNVTGIRSDVDAVTALLHRYGALAFWDYAAAAPYLRIEMHPDDSRFHKDAIFLSPHKLIGGPGTPGVLVARRKLFNNRIPAVPGGGTVAYVNAEAHDYLADVQHREEGGTPAIVESIRAGLVFQLKKAVGEDNIEAREEHFVRRAIERWRRHPRLQILGNLEAPRLSILSFMTKAGDHFPERTYLHHNFMVAVLNDLFGIQTRGGCSCAGPYGHRLLKIDLLRSKAYEQAILCGYEGIKPGWVRLNFNYFISEAVFEFLLNAIELAAEHAWKLLPAYRFDLQTGLWRHRSTRPLPALSLLDISYASGHMEYRSQQATEPESALLGYLEDAKSILTHPPAADPDSGPIADQSLPEAAEKLRWFPLPSEF